MAVIEFWSSHSKWRFTRNLGQKFLVSPFFHSFPLWQSCITSSEHSCNSYYSLWPLMAALNNKNKTLFFKLGKQSFIIWLYRVLRKSFLQLAIWASWSRHLLAQTSFQLAPKTFWLTELISQFFCYSNSSKNITCLSGKLKTEFTGPGLSDTTFFARCVTTNI